MWLLVLSWCPGFKSEQRGEVEAVEEEAVLAEGDPRGGPRKYNPPVSRTPRALDFPAPGMEHEIIQRGGSVKG
jgi:hypothetical protein